MFLGLCRARVPVSRAVEVSGPGKQQEPLQNIAPHELDISENTAPLKWRAHEMLRQKLSANREQSMDELSFVLYLI